MRIDDPGKAFTRFLAPRCFLQQILVLTEEHAPQTRCAIQEFRVSNPIGAILLCRYDIHIPQS